MSNETLTLIWTTQATGELHLNQRAYLLRPFRLFLLLPGTEWQTPVPEKLYEQFSIRWSTPSSEDSRLPIFQAGHAEPFLDLEPDELLPVSVLYQLSKTFPQPVPFPRLFQHLAFTLLVHLADCYRSRHPQANEALAAWKQLNDLIGQHYREQRSCRFYAKALHTSARKLNALARGATGKVVEELVMERLYQAAEELLSSSGLSVKHIAYELGFADQAHFNRFFHKFNGQSPMAYRHQQAAST